MTALALVCLTFGWFADEIVSRVASVLARVANTNNTEIHHHV